MATIKRAKNYFIYLFAILISALFALAGRSAPTWASEIKSTHAAKVFDDEIYRVAAAQNTTSTVQGSTFFGVLRQPTVSQPAYQPPDLRVNYRVNDNLPPAFHSYLPSINQQLDNKLNEIRGNLSQNQLLDASELSLLYSAQNSAQITNMVNQYNVLINMMQTLIDNQNR